MDLKSLFLPIVRHVLTTAGGGLVASGTLTDGDVQTSVGAIMALIGVGLSVWNAKNQKAK